MTVCVVLGREMRTDDCEFGKPQAFDRLAYLVEGFETGVMSESEGVRKKLRHVVA
jgi:hypothetical protein